MATIFRALFISSPYNFVVQCYCCSLVAVRLSVCLSVSLRLCLCLLLVSRELSRPRCTPSCVCVCVCVVEQFYGQSRVYSDVLDYLNMIFTGVFTIEFILKLYAFRIKVSAYLAQSSQPII